MFTKIYRFFYLAGEKKSPVKASDFDKFRELNYGFDQGQKN